MENVQYVLLAVNVLCTIIIGVIGLLFKRVIGNYDDAIKRLTADYGRCESKVIKMDKTLAVLIDRDRRKRVADYESEDGFPNLKGT